MLILKDAPFDNYKGYAILQNMVNNSGGVVTIKCEDMKPGIRYSDIPIFKFGFQKNDWLAVLQ